MRRPSVRWRPFAILGAALLLGGVLLFRAGSPSGPVGPVEIKGRLEDAQGRPLVRLSLRFHPQEEGGKVRPSLLCLTQEKGEFVGRCLPGRYRVTLSVPPGQGKDVEVPQRYRSVEETPWEVTVPRGGTSRIRLRVEE